MIAIFKRVLAVTFALLSLCLTACAPRSQVKQALPDTDFAGEIVSNGGLAARQGEWIYYLNGDNFTRDQKERFHAYAGALCRMKADASEKDVVVDADVSLFTLLGERIQLCIFENGQSVAASVRTDGTDFRTLGQIDNIYDGGCYACAGGYVYFTRQYCLYRMDTDGKNVCRLTDFPVYNLRASEREAYFTREVNGSIGSLYRVPHGQTEAVQITAEPAYVLSADEDEMFCYMLGNGYVYRFRPSTSDFQAVVYGGYTEYAFSEDFYAVSVEKEDAGELYLIPAGGGGRVLLAEQYGRCMVFAGQYLYYINAGKLNTLYRCRLDGSLSECVCEEFVLDIDTLDVVDEYLYFFSDSDYDRVYRLHTESGQVECVELEEFSVVGD